MCVTLKYAQQKRSVHKRHDPVRRGYLLSELSKLGDTRDDLAQILLNDLILRPEGGKQDCIAETNNEQKGLFLCSNRGAADELHLA